MVEGIRIRIYSIWKIKSKEYHNREMKESAYSALTEKVKTIDPQANKETVLKKINNLRSSFRKERKKVLLAMKSGMSSEDIYVPKLWYYKDRFSHVRILFFMYGITIFNSSK